MAEELKSRESTVLHKLPKSTPVEIQTFISACMCKDPRIRPTAEQLLQHPALMPQHCFRSVITEYVKDRCEERAGTSAEDDPTGLFKDF